MNDTIKWEASNFQDKDALYDLFEKANYTLGNVEPVDPEFVFGKDKSQLTENVESIYHLVNEEDDEFQIWLVNSSKECRKKSWRKLIINIVKQGIAEYVIFITEDFKEFWIEIVADERDKELILDPNNPSSKADKFIRDLLNRRPLFDPKGLTASQLQLTHELTASKLVSALKTYDEKKIRHLFQRAGLCSISDMDLICSRDEAPLKNAIIELNFSKIDTKNWINTNLARIKGNYRVKSNKDIYWILLLEKDSLSYISEKGDIFSSIKYPEKREDLIKLLTSMIACIDIRAAFNGETFESQFGPFSPFYAKALFFMVKYLNEHKIELKVIKEEWKRYFGKVYKKEDLDEELLIKHSYLSLIVKNVLFCKYLPEKIVENAGSFIELTEFLEKKGVEMFFYDFYTWANNIIELREDIFKALHGALYESEDIFRVIYQDMVSPGTRHALGEFYTPPELVQLIVDEIFDYDKIILDPACGSGTFLVEIINRIKTKYETQKDQINRMGNVYGFDVNPIAVLVTKANLLLNLEGINIEKIPINIFLTDSIKVIERNPQKNLIWGSYMTFLMGNIGELKINVKFFEKSTSKDSTNYLNQFLKFLQYIDEQMTKNINNNTIIVNFDKEFKQSWLNDVIPSCPNTYRNNIHHMITILGELQSKNQNHIWLYLLYNSIGAHLLKNNVDIIVGNPPWLTYKDLKSDSYKKDIDNLSQALKLKPSNIAHIELSILFFKYCSLKFLKKDGKISLLMNQTIIRGETFEKFRSFQGFSNISIWKFIDPTFNIAHIALFGKKESSNYLPPLKFPITIIKGTHITGYEKLNSENYIPTYITNLKNQRIVGELFPETEKDNILKIEKSVYKEHFYDGANIIPNLMLLVNIHDNKKDSEFRKITPRPKYYSSATERWRFFPYLKSEIRKIYLFDTIKGGNICPFVITDPNNTFLPITKKVLFDRNMDEKTKSHYDSLNETFLEHRTGRSENYWDYINHNSQLSMQYGSKYKVVYNKDGSIVKASIIPESILVDNSVIFYKTDNKNEGYYLIGILNSPLMTKNIQKRGGTGYKGSTRHIQQLPLDYAIPKFQKKIPLHMEIVKIAKECELFVNNFITTWRKSQYIESKTMVKCNFCENIFITEKFDNHLQKCKKFEAIPRDNRVKFQKSEKLSDYKDVPIKPLTINNRLYKNSYFAKKLEILDSLVTDLLK